MPAYRCRMHVYSGRWHTIYLGAPDMATAMTRAIDAVKAEDPEASFIDEVEVKRMTPWERAWRGAIQGV